MIDRELNKRLGDIEATLHAVIEGDRQMAEVLQMIGQGISEILKEMQRPPSYDLGELLARLVGAIDGLSNRVAEMERKLDARATASS